MHLIQITDEVMCMICIGGKFTVDGSLANERV